LNQKITLAATTLALVAGLGTLVFWSSRPSYSLLYGRLDESEAAKVIAYLDEAKNSLPGQPRQRDDHGFLPTKSTPRACS
jgi:flagellar biosynthesis/type III secretory pathway M-ring protein FliF/YscJ